MPLLKIGDTYLNSDHIVTAYDDGTAIEITTVHGKETYYNYGADALREWLENNAEELELHDDDEDDDPQPAPVETVRFKVGDKVREIDYRKNSGVITCVLPHDPEYDQRYLVSWNGDRFYFDVELTPAD